MAKIYLERIARTFDKANSISNHNPSIRRLELDNLRSRLEEILEHAEARGQSLDEAIASSLNRDISRENRVLKGLNRRRRMHDKNEPVRIALKQTLAICKLAMKP